MAQFLERHRLELEVLVVIAVVGGGAVIGAFALGARIVRALGF